MAVSSYLSDRELLEQVGGLAKLAQSAIANFFTLQMATKHQLPAIYFSLEMTKKQLQYRLWSLISEFHCYRHLKLTKIRGSRIRKQRAGRIQLNQQEMDSIVKIRDICANLPIFMNENRVIKKSRYIPKRLVPKVERMNQEKVAVKRILEVLGVKESEIAV